jgi:hypothetical protein
MMLAVGPDQHGLKRTRMSWTFKPTFASTQAAILSKMGTAVASCGGDKGSEATAANGAALVLRWRGSALLAGLQAAKNARC